MAGRMYEVPVLELKEELGAYKQKNEYEFHNHCHHFSLQLEKDEITKINLTLKVRPVPPFSSF